MTSNFDITNSYLRQNPLDKTCEIQNLFLKNLKKILIYSQLDSTNQQAKKLEALGLESGSIIITEQQTAGHGRMGRTWISKPGDISLSIILREQHIPTEASWLSIMSGVAMVEVLANLQVSIKLKWPNDLVYLSKDKFDYFGNYKKLGGILVENIINQNKISASIIGLGLNINNNQDLKFYIPHCGYLGELNLLINKSQILDNFFVIFDRMLDQVNHENIINKYVKYCVTLGQRVSITQGSRVYTGVAVGINHDGALLVQEGASTHKICAGDVGLA